MRLQREGAIVALHVCLVQQVVALLHKVVEVAVRSEASPQFIAGPLEYNR